MSANKINNPLLKYSCIIENKSIIYRNVQYNFDNPILFNVIGHFDGKKNLSEIKQITNLGENEIVSIVEELFRNKLLLEGNDIIRSDGLVSGLELYWQLEKLLFDVRNNGFFSKQQKLLDSIHNGDCDINVVKGFCIEQCHLVRNASEEIAIAVANSPNEDIRELMKGFFLDEQDHGEILVDGLMSWGMSKMEIQKCIPLPGTAALIHTYNDLARKDTLLYATAMINDEARPMDIKAIEKSDPYVGMRNHFKSIPLNTIEKFAWHASIDSNKDHGDFFEKIFKSYNIVSDTQIYSCISALCQIVEQRQIYAYCIEKYYSSNDWRSRLRNL